MIATATEQRCKSFSEVLEQLSEESMTRIADIALGMQLQRQIEAEKETPEELEEKGEKE